MNFPPASRPPNTQDATLTEKPNEKRTKYLIADTVPKIKYHKYKIHSYPLQMASSYMLFCSITQVGLQSQPSIVYVIQTINIANAVCVCVCVCVCV